MGDGCGVKWGKIQTSHPGTAIGTFKTRANQNTNDRLSPIMIEENWLGLKKFGLGGMKNANYSLLLFKSLFCLIYFNYCLLLHNASLLNDDKLLAKDLS